MPKNDMNNARFFKETARQIGVSHAGLARLIGYIGPNTAVTASKITSGAKGMSGPARQALEYLAQGVPDDAMKSILPEYFVGGDPTGVCDGDFVARLWYPRFIGIINTPDPVLAAAAVDFVALADIETLYIIMWLDDPAAADVDDLLKRAVSKFVQFGGVRRPLGKDDPGDI